MIDNELYVKWMPPYANNYKYTQHRHIKEAKLMVKWLKSVGADAVIILRTYDEEDVKWKEQN